MCTRLAPATRPFWLALSCKPEGKEGITGFVAGTWAMSVSLAYYCYCRTNERGYIAVCSVVDPHRTEVENHYLKGHAIVRKLLVLRGSVPSQTALARLPAIIVERLRSPSASDDAP